MLQVYNNMLCKLHVKTLSSIDVTGWKNNHTVIQITCIKYQELKGFQNTNKDQ